MVTGAYASVTYTKLSKESKNIKGRRKSTSEGLTQVTIFEKLL